MGFHLRHYHLAMAVREYNQKYKKNYSYHHDFDAFFLLPERLQAMHELIELYNQSDCVMKFIFNSEEKDFLAKRKECLIGIKKALQQSSLAELTKQKQQLRQLLKPISLEKKLTYYSWRKRFIATIYEFHEDPVFHTEIGKYWLSWWKTQAMCHLHNHQALIYALKLNLLLMDAYQICLEEINQLFWRLPNIIAQSYLQHCKNIIDQLAQQQTIILESMCARLETWDKNHAVHSDIHIQLYDTLRVLNFFKQSRSIDSIDKLSATHFQHYVSCIHQYGLPVQQKRLKHLSFFQAQSHNSDWTTMINQQQIMIVPNCVKNLTTIQLNEIQQFFRYFFRGRYIRYQLLMDGQMLFAMYQQIPTETNCLLDTPVTPETLIKRINVCDDIEGDTRRYLQKLNQFQQSLNFLIHQQSIKFINDLKSFIVVKIYEMALRQLELIEAIWENLKTVVWEKCTLEQLLMCPNEWIVCLNKLINNIQEIDRYGILTVQFKQRCRQSIAAIFPYYDCRNIGQWLNAFITGNFIDYPQTKKIYKIFDNLCRHPNSTYERIVYQWIDDNHEIFREQFNHFFLQKLNEIEKNSNDLLVHHLNQVIQLVRRLTGAYDGQKITQFWYTVSERLMQILLISMIKSEIEIEKIKSFICILQEISKINELHFANRPLFQYLPEINEVINNYCARCAYAQGILYSQPNYPTFQL